MKHVDSYFIEKFDSGIILLLVNLDERGVYYHRYNDTTYLFNNEEEEEQAGIGSEFILEIPEMEEILSKDRYVRESSQEKDQVYFYFIPTKLVFHGEILKEWRKI